MEEQQQPVRLMQFISESKLEELKASRGASIQDGTLLPERPLHEILRENKQKQDKEFKERFKHLPPKALDVDEMEFLEKIDEVKREHDRKVAKEEAQELSNFDAAVAKRLQAATQQQQQQEEPQQQQHPQQRKRELVLAGPKRPSQSSILASVVTVRPVQKKAKLAQQQQQQQQQQHQAAEEENVDEARSEQGKASAPGGVITGLVAAYGEDDDDDDVD